MGVCRVDHTEFKEKECESQLLYLHKAKKKMEKNPKNIILRVQHYEIFSS